MKQTSIAIMCLLLVGLTTPPDLPGGGGPHPQSLSIASRPFGTPNSTYEGTGPQSSNASRHIPLQFEGNIGNLREPAKFIARTGKCTLFFRPTELLLLACSGTKGLSTSRRAAAFAADEHPGYELQSTGSTDGREENKVTSSRIQLLGANPHPNVHGVDLVSGKTNYLIGDSPKSWRTNVPNFGKVQYDDVYPGIDLIFYGNESHLEYDFVLAPGASPQAIRMAFKGAGQIHLDENGNLTAATPEVGFFQHRPIVFQMRDGRKEEVTGRFNLLGIDECGFEVGEYDKTKPLIIDPVLDYSTYLGGSGNELGQSIALDSSGNIYVAGTTLSPDFRITDSAFQKTLDPNGFGVVFGDIFVSKLDPTGTVILYSTFLGGQGFESFPRIAVDASGSVYVTGETMSLDFPTTQNAYQRKANSSGSSCALAVCAPRAFVCKLNVTGTDLIYSTYLRNKNSILTGQEQGIGIAIDSTGRAYVAGVTLSDQFPTTEGAFQKDWSALGGARSAGFLAVIDPSMSGEESLVYSSYLAAIGGSFTSANSVAVDSSGKAYVVGSTFGGSFPITGDTFQTDPFLNNEVFALKIDPLKFGQSSLLYATLLGGEGSDYANGVAVDASGNAYIVGLTTSRFLPTVGGFQTSYSGDVDAFIAKLNAWGSDLLFSTYLGGDSADVAQAVTTDSAGAAYVVGTTESLNFPVRNPLQPNHSGLFFGDAFVVKIDAAGSLVYSTFLGGIGDDAGNAITVDATGSAYVVGTAGATDFPRTNNAIQSGKLGVRDAFFAKISSPPVAAPLAIVSAAVTDGQLLVFGEGFDDNSRIVIDSEEHNAATKRGKMDTVLVSKRAGKKIKPGQTVTLMVKSSLGAISPAFKFTRPIR